MKKKALPTLGLQLPDAAKSTIVTFRLSEDDVRKLDELGKPLKLGRSSIARLIVEKFIAENAAATKGRG